MPKVNRRTRRGGRRRRAGNSTKGSARTQTTIIPFRDTLTFSWSSSSTPQYQNVTPSISTRMSAIYENWELYRIDSLQLQLDPIVVGSGGNYEMAVAYVPNVGGTSPATYDSVVETGSGFTHSSGKTVPTRYSVPKSLLRGLPNPWLPTVASDPNTQFGLIVLAPNVSVTTTLYLRVGLLISFKSPCIAGIETTIPMIDAIELGRKREYEEQLKRKLLLEVSGK